MCSCKDRSIDYSYEKELEDFGLNEIILSNIKINNEDKLYAIAINYDLDEVLIEYTLNNENNIHIIETYESPLSFSVCDLFEIIGRFDVKMKNAFSVILRKSSKIEIDDKSLLHIALGKSNIKNMKCLKFYYEDNLYVITYDLGDYYIANETKEELYYPVYLKYNDIP